jgi:hypothetical protein
LHTLGQSEHTADSERACNHTKDTHIEWQFKLQDDKHEPREDNHSEIEFVPGIAEVITSVRNDLHDRFNCEYYTED